MVRLSIYPLEHLTETGSTPSSTYDVCMLFQFNLFPIVAHGTLATHGAYGASTQGLNSDSLPKSGMFFI